MRVVVIASDKTVASMMCEKASGLGIEVHAMEVAARIFHDFRTRSVSDWRSGDDYWQQYLESNQVDLVIVALATETVAPAVSSYVRSANRVPVLVGNHIHLYSLLRLLASAAG